MRAPRRNAPLVTGLAVSTSEQSSRAAPLPTASRRRLLALVGLAALCLVGFLTVYLVARGDAGHQIDEAGIAGRTAIGTQSFRAADLLLNVITVSSLALAIIALGLVAVARGRPLLALLAAAAIGGSVAIAQVLKVVLPQRDLAGYDVGLRFPSGHSTIALSLALAAVLVAPAVLRRPLAVLGVVFASAVGIATVAAGWHRPSDVAGGFLLASGWTAGLTAMTLAASPRDLRSEHRAAVARPLDRLRTGLLWGAAAVIATGIGVAVGGHEAGRLRFVHVTPNFVAIATGITALAALALAALVGSLGVLRERLAPEA